MRIGKACVGEYVYQLLWQIRFNYYCYQTKFLNKLVGYQIFWLSGPAEGYSRNESWVPNFTSTFSYSAGKIYN